MPLDSPKPPASAAAIAVTFVITTTAILAALASVVEVNPGGTVSLIVKTPTGGQGKSRTEDNLINAQDVIGKVKGRFCFMRYAL